MNGISVIIPTYNRADKIKKSVQSVLDQTYGEFDLIIIDDASSDDTESVVKSIQDSRIRYKKLKANLGAAGARNEGVKQTDSKYIAFHDSDDLWMPDKLEKQLRYMENNPDVGMVYGKLKVISPERTYEFPNETIDGDLEGNLYSWLLKRNTIDTPSMFIRKKCFVETGGFDSSLRCLEDWEFAIRFSRKFKIGYIDEVLLDSFVSEGGVSGNIGSYYETRCKIVALHKEDIIRMGLLDEIVMDVFSRAEKSGVLSQVKKMMMAYLT